MQMRSCFLLIGITLLWVGSSAAAVWEVRIEDFFFEPNVVTIQVGDSVHWKNFGNFAHTATSGTNCTPDGIFSSGNIATNAEFGWRCTQSGEYPYFCVPHCSGGMTGVITAVPLAAAIRTWGKIRMLYR